MTQITYIYHDCFFVELQKCNLVFDFWKDPIGYTDGLPYFLSTADKEKPLYVFVSHHHKDHYTKKIFNWEEYFPKIKYIISSDVAKMARHILTPNSIYSGRKPCPDNVIILREGERWEDSSLRTEAFGSTDIGNSYYTEIKDNMEKQLSFFHAGDLNAWLWKDESTPEEVREALDKYLGILDNLKSKHPSIDFVMFPVDSRIGTDYAEGAKRFVREINVGHFFPMHFGLYETREEKQKRSHDAAKVKDYANTDRGEYICLQAPYSAYITSSLNSAAD